MKRIRTVWHPLLGAMLLLFTLWLGWEFGWLRFWAESPKTSGNSDRIASENGIDITTKRNTKGRNAVIDPAAKARSLLKLRAGETGIFRLDPGESLDGFAGIKREGPTGIPRLEGMIGKTSLLKSFEQALHGGAQVITHVGDQDITEYTSKNLYMKVEVIARNHPFEDLRMEIHHGNAKSSAEITVGSGSALLFSLPEPDGGWVVVLRGDTEKGATDEAP